MSAVIHPVQATVPASPGIPVTASSAARSAVARSGARAGAGAAIGIRGLSKQYGERVVLRDIDLDIAAGEFVAIVGRSGCGKSTLLRLLAGLEPGQASGQSRSGDGIRLDGAKLRQQAVAEQGVRLMFQDARLLPWKKVADNVALGLQGPDAKQRVHEALAAVGLAERAGEWPARLSGGQRQRVALARALVHRPRLLLLDEPLGALDALTRIEMQQLIEKLWLAHGFTAVLVTHDVSEAVALADRVLLIEDHRISLDDAVPLPRPRERGDAAFAALEDRVLRRVLQQPAREDEQHAARHAAGLLQASHVRWAV